jgi:hypothetical protein
VLVFCRVGLLSRAFRRAISGWYDRADFFGRFFLQPHPTAPPQVPPHFNLRFLINRQFEDRCNEIPYAIANRGKLHGSLNKTNRSAKEQCRESQYVARDQVPHLVCAMQHSVAQLSAVISPLHRMLLCK